MRNIIDFINESNSYVNIILNGSGSMSNKDMEKTIKKLLNQFKGANLFVYDTNNDEVVPLDDINNFKPGGPHNYEFGGLSKFFGEHLGEQNIYIAN